MRYPNIYIKNTTKGPRGKGVFALETIPKFTQICEYIGNVMTNKEIIQNKKDNANDKMILFKNKKKETLVIIPNIHSNIARFINQAPKNGKANVRNIKCLIRDKISIILYACEKIEKNDELVYNYT